MDILLFGLFGMAFALLFAGGFAIRRFKWMIVWLLIHAAVIYGYAIALDRGPPRDAIGIGAVFLIFGVPALIVWTFGFGIGVYSRLTEGPGEITKLRMFWALVASAYTVGFWLFWAFGL